MKMAKGSGILITYALGSCIGLCFQDPALHLGALLHVMLPMNMEAGRKNAFKYADTGIRETVRQMTHIRNSDSNFIVHSVTPSFANKKLRDLTWRHGGPYAAF